MKRLQAFALGLLALALLTGGNCSRARVESMNHMNEGVVYAQQKRYIDAVESLEQATVVDPSNHQAFHNLALVHIEMRKFEAAKEDLNRAISAKDDVAGYHEKLGTVLMQLEDWEAARDAFKESIETDDKLFKAHYKLAQVYEKLADQTNDGKQLVDLLENALREYTEAIKRGPRFIQGYSSLGRLYADLGYLDHAAQVLQSGQQVAPEGSEEAASLHHLLGTVYQQQKKFDNAVEEFEAALDIAPGMNDAMFSVGWTYDLQGNREEARRYLKKFVDVAGGGEEAPDHYVSAAKDKLLELGEGP